MPLGVNVGVVQHRVTVAADMAVPIGLALHQHAVDAVGAGRDLRERGDAEIVQHAVHGSDVERVEHRSRRHRQAAGPA